MSIQIQDIQRVSKHLERLTPAKPKVDGNRIYSVRETIMLMAEKLIAMKTKGFTNKELAAALSEQGINIKPQTLGRYLHDFQREYSKPSGKAAKSSSEQPSDNTVGASPSTPMTMEIPPPPQS